MPYLHRTEWRSGRLRFVERQLFTRHFVDHQLALGCARSRQFSGVFTISRKCGPVISKVKCINLALQGGSAHGAFTWGVLNRLIEEPRIEVEGVSATSAGAMNATVSTTMLTISFRQSCSILLHPTTKGLEIRTCRISATDRDDESDSSAPSLAFHWPIAERRSDSKVICDQATWRRRPDHCASWP